MTVRVVRLGSPRAPGEGLRIGTVRRPPGGVAAERFASENWYDVWFPNLAPSVDAIKLGKAAGTDREWAAFTKKYRREMAEPGASRTLDLLAALSHTADFSVGCYCEDAAHCHRSVLRELLATRGAKLGRERHARLRALRAHWLAQRSAGSPQEATVRSMNSRTGGLKSE